MQRLAICYFLARLQTWRAIIFSRVCLSMFLWPALLPFNVNRFYRFWRNMVTRTLLWSSLAATIMSTLAAEGPRDTFLKISKNSQKSQNSNFKVLCIVKKIWLDSNKTDGGDRFWSLPLWRFRQWHCCSSTTLGGIFWLNRRCGSMQRSKLGGIPNWGIRNWERNRAVKTNRLVCLLFAFKATYKCMWQPKRHLGRFSRLCTGDFRVALYFAIGCPFPFSKLPLARWGIWTPI